MDMLTKLNEVAEKPAFYWFFKKFSEIVWLERDVVLSIDDLSAWQPPELPSLTLPVVYQMGTEADVLEMNADPRLETAGDAVHNLAMIRAGYKLVLARHEGEIVFYAWAVTGRKSAFDRFFVMLSDEFIVARVFTRKDFRGHGLYPRGLMFMFPRMMELGFKRALVDVASQNHPSINAALKAGFTMLDADFYTLRVLFRSYLIPAGCLKDRFVKKENRSERI